MAKKPATARRFHKGGPAGPGRPAGSKNRTTIDARVLLRRIVATWDVVDGDKLLARIARDDPVQYMKLVMPLFWRIGRDYETAALPDLKIIITQAPPSKPKPVESTPKPSPIHLAPPNGQSRPALTEPQPSTPEPIIHTGSPNRPSGIDWDRDFRSL